MGGSTPSPPLGTGTPTVKEFGGDTPHLPTISFAQDILTQTRTFQEVYCNVNSFTLRLPRVFLTQQVGGVIRTLGGGFSSG